MRQSKITDFVNVNELSSGSEPCQTTDDLGQQLDLFDSKVGVATNDKHRSTK
jgi:hypothetical protein